MPDVEQKLNDLGARLRRQRLQRNETQSVFAARIGISVPTLHKMESGDPSVLIGHWITALDILDRAQEIDSLLVEKDLFDLFETSSPKGRKRASRKRS